MTKLVWTAQRIFKPVLHLVLILTEKKFYFGMKKSERKSQTTETWMLAHYFRPISFNRSFLPRHRFAVVFLGFLRKSQFLLDAGRSSPLVTCPICFVCLSLGTTGSTLCQIHSFRLCRTDASRVFASASLVPPGRCFSRLSKFCLPRPCYLAVSS